MARYPNQARVGAQRHHNGADAKGNFKDPQWDQSGAPLRELEVTQRCVGNKYQLEHTSLVIMRAHEYAPSSSSCKELGLPANTQRTSPTLSVPR